MRLKLLLVIAVLLTACAPYKMDIRQGNYVSQEMREKLKIGMTRSQVHTLLGSPLLTDPFHPNRWDYVYRLEHDKELVEEHRLTLFFDGDVLKRIDESGMPAKPVTEGK